MISSTGAVLVEDVGLVGGVLLRATPLWGSHSVEAVVFFEGVEGPTSSAGRYALRCAATRRDRWARRHRMGDERARRYGCVVGSSGLAPAPVPFQVGVALADE